jgi:hypothetical protein
MKMPNIDITDFGDRYTLHVTVNLTRELKVRMKIAALLFKMAAWVLGCGIEIKEKLTGGPDA